MWNNAKKKHYTNLKTKVNHIKTISKFTSILWWMEIAMDFNLKTLKVWSEKWIDRL